MSVLAGCSYNFVLASEGSLRPNPGHAPSPEERSESRRGQGGHRGCTPWRTGGFTTHMPGKIPFAARLALARRVIALVTFIIV
ncbi:MAG TPA: hypothetical protein VE549_06905, partial [Myxococcaceae bacterium]|nr:hypothetical protein [Myxococcaceae bacterium]